MTDHTTATIPVYSPGGARAGGAAIVARHLTRREALEALARRLAAISTFAETVAAMSGAPGSELPQGPFVRDPSDPLNVLIEEARAALSARDVESLGRPIDMGLPLTTEDQEAAGIVYTRLPGRYETAYSPIGTVIEGSLDMLSQRTGVVRWDVGRDGADPVDWGMIKTFDDVDQVMRLNPQTGRAEDVWIDGYGGEWITSELCFRSDERTGD